MNFSQVLKQKKSRARWTEHSLERFREALKIPHLPNISVLNEWALGSSFVSFYTVEKFGFEPQNGCFYFMANIPKSPILVVKRHNRLDKVFVIVTVLDTVMDKQEYYQKRFCEKVDNVLSSKKNWKKYLKGELSV